MTKNNSEQVLEHNTNILFQLSVDTQKCQRTIIVSMKIWETHENVWPLLIYMKCLGILGPIVPQLITNRNKSITLRWIDNIHHNSNRTHHHIINLVIRHRHRAQGETYQRTPRWVGSGHRWNCLPPTWWKPPTRASPAPATRPRSPSPAWASPAWRPLWSRRLKFETRGQNLPPCTSTGVDQPKDFAMAMFWKMATEGTTMIADPSVFIMSRKFSVSLPFVTWKAGSWTLGNPSGTFPVMSTRCRLVCGRGSSERTYLRSWKGLYRTFGATRRRRWWKTTQSARFYWSTATTGIFSAWGFSPSSVPSAAQNRSTSQSRLIRCTTKARRWR